MASMEETFKKAIADLEIPGAVLKAVNRDGTFKYDATFGKRSMKPDSEPLQPDAIMWIASCTKLVTSVASMQLVERGLVKLDDPVYDHIPELKDRPIITSLTEDGKTVEEPHKNPITLRLLLTHSSGLVYEEMHPFYTAWRKHHNLERSQTPKILEFYPCPLIFEPGTSWNYGTGIDFVGLLIMRVTGQSLEEYFRKNIFEPCGVDSSQVTFAPNQHPDLKARMPDMSERDVEKKTMKVSDFKSPFIDLDPKEEVEPMGGMGIYTSPEQYIKILYGILTTDTDEKLLKKTSVEQLFAPSLTPPSKATLNAFLENPDFAAFMGGLPLTASKDHGLGGLLLEDDIEGWRKKGTLIWGGYPNLTWSIDRETGLTCFYASQVVPPGDMRSAELSTVFEKDMYRRLREKSSL